MKIFLLVLLSFSISYICDAQKEPLAIDSYKSWPTVGNGGISNDGKFVFYYIENQPVGSSTGVIRSTETAWEIELVALKDMQFSNDSKELYAMLPNDTLLIIDVYKHNLKKVGNVTTFKLVGEGKSQWILTRSSKNDSITIKRLREDKGFEFENFTNYIIGNTGNYVIIQQLFPDKNEFLNLLDLMTGKLETIYKGYGINNVVFDHKDAQIAFWINSNNGNTIWLYHMKEGLTKLLADSLLIKKTGSLYSQAGINWRFGQDDSRLFFTLKQTINNTLSNPNLIIWNYKDQKLRVKDLRTDSKQYRSIDYVGVLDIRSKKAMQLTHEGDEVISDGPTNQTPDDFLIIKTSCTKDRLSDMNDSDKFSYQLYSTRTGAHYPLKMRCTEALSRLSISPSGKYVIYYDPLTAAYYCYSITEKRTRQLLSSADESLIDLKQITYPKPYYTVGISGWLPQDQAILINGTYNIWQLDPDGKIPPINLTGNLQKRDSIVFYMPLSKYKIKPSKSGTILMSAFNFQNKEFALFNYKLNAINNPDNLFFRPIYTDDLRIIYARLDRTLLKAKDRDIYLLRSENVTNAPNYYLTEDFKKYKSISDIQPQLKYNWMTSELHKYKDSRGNLLEGVLYKPENFDSTKKYPIVFNFYEQKSQELNEFESPDNILGDIHIAWLVSNGFLVYKANIFSAFGKPGDGALISVNAAADHLKNYKWVDSTKMAITGHSFGGYEVNYIITHSDRFAAAVSAAGVDNLIESFNTPMMDVGVTWEDYVRYMPYKMVKSLSEDHDLYIQNSPIFFADKIKTPLLLMHNPNDYNVVFSQGLSFFTELRRLKKKVWMLSYKGDEHGISEANLIDYYTRLTDFLNCYLKDKPMPDWMLNPVQATNSY